MAANQRKNVADLSPAILEAKAYEALIRLWVLRLVVPLGGIRELAASYGYRHDDLAEYLDVLHEEGKFDRKLAKADLKNKHARAERRRKQSQLPSRLIRNIDRCAQLLGWNDTDKAIIAFVVLMETDLWLERAASLIEDVSTARLIEVLTVVLDLDRDQVRHSISPRGALAESGFLKVDPRLTRNLFSKMSLLSDELADQLRHSDADLLHMLRDVLAQTGPGTLTLKDFDHLRDSLELLHPYLKRSLENQACGVNILIHGAPGTGKTELTLALAQDLGCDLFEVSSQNESGNGIDGGARLRAFRAAQSLLRQRKAMILFDEAEDVFDGSWQYGRSKSSAQAQKAWMNRLLETNTVPSIWLSNDVECMDPAFIRRFDIVLEMPLMRGRQREHLLEKTCGDLIDARTKSRLLEAHDLAPAVIQRAVRVVRAVQEDLPASRTGIALERLIESTLTAQGHAPLSAGQADTLPAGYNLNHIAADVDLAQVAEGIVQARTGRICLYGPPGTGKTAFGRWLAHRMNVPLHARKVSDIVAPYVGQTERNLARVFRDAAAEGAVLLLDEVDSFLQDRQHAHHSWEVTAVNEMLTQMESYQDVFIASTNLMDGLDQAALRRFDLKVKFGYLRPAQAWELFEANCQSLGLPEADGAVRTVLERMTNLTPGDFAAVIRQHRFRPLGSGQAMMAALEAECRIKKDSRNPLGFM